jgi:hypothetical protein
MGQGHIVIRSLEDRTGGRCVDLLRTEAGFAWAECRRDPEDNHGWRRLGNGRDGFATEAGALGDARAQVGWLEDT